MSKPEHVRAAIDYNPDTGEIRSRRTGRVLIAASLTIRGAKLITERCLWAYYYNEWPPEDKLIDHVNRNRHDRRINNLRLATYPQNGFNMGSRNPYAKGVTYDDTRLNNPWRAQIRINGRKTNLGRFKTLQEAIEAYKKAAIEHHGEFVCLD